MADPDSYGGGANRELGDNTALCCHDARKKLSLLHREDASPPQAKSFLEVEK